MEHRQELAGVRIDNLNVREAMRKIENWLNQESLAVVEAVNMKTIVSAGEDETVRRCLETAELVFPSDREILQELGVVNAQRLHEVEDNLLLAEFLRRCQRGHRELWLLTETQEQMEELSGYIRDVCDRPPVIAGRCALDGVGLERDELVNEINAVAPQAVIALLSSPGQEHFLAKSRQMLNTHLWFGIGSENEPLNRRRTPRLQMRRLRTRFRLRRQIQTFDSEETDQWE